MNILIPEYPSDFIFEIHSTNCLLYYNDQLIAQNVFSLLIFHIINGKYLCCFNENEKKILNLTLNSNLKEIFITHSKGIILCKSNE